MDSLYSSLNAQWLSFVATWPYNEHWFITAFLTGAHAAIWIPFNFFLFVVNYWGPAAQAFEKYKIRKGHLPPWRLVQQCLTEMIINQAIIFPLSTYFLLPYLTPKGIYRTGDLPGLVEILTHFAATALINDTLFYWAHRLLHSNNWMYRNFHSQHHRFVDSIGIAAEFASPVESIFANVIPTFLGLFICRAHVVTAGLWLFWRIGETVEAHSGFAFPWSPFQLPFGLGARAHDWHHSHNRGVYGMFAFWDRIMGTDIEYREYLKKGDSNKSK